MTTSDVLYAFLLAANRPAKNLLIRFRGLHPNAVDVPLVNLHLKHVADRDGSEQVVIHTHHGGNLRRRTSTGQKRIKANINGQGAKGAE